MFFALIFLLVPGDTVIQSGIIPAQPQLKLHFEVVFRVSPNQEVIKAPWGGAMVSLDCNKLGQIFLIDPGNMRILQFSDTGKLMNRVGREGQGPGEFSALIGFRVQSDGRLLAVNNIGSHLALMIFNADGKYQDQKLIATGNRTFQTAIPDTKGAHVLAQSMVSTPGSKEGVLFFETGLLDTKALESKLLVSRVREVPFDPSKLMNVNYWSEYLADLIKMSKQGLGLIVQSGDTILAAKTDKYEITRYNTNGKILQKMSKDYKPVPLKGDEIEELSDPIFSEVVDAMPPQVHQLISRGVVDRAIELAELAPVKPPVLGLIPIADDMFLVVRDVQDSVVIADLFGRDGKCQATVTLPPIPVNMFGSVFGSPSTLIFNGDKAYALVKNQAEDLDLVCYSWSLK